MSGTDAEKFERLIIVGAGGFGREVILWAEDCRAAGRLPPVAGFLDDKATALPAAYRAPCLGTTDAYRIRPGDGFIIAIGSPERKRALSGKLAARGARFATLIHPTAIIARTASIGEGVIMTAHTVASADARVEHFATLNNFSGLGHDSRIGAYATVSSLVDVTGNVDVGTGVIIGSGARLLPGVRVGDNAVIGAGSVVIRTVKPGTTVFSPPAKTLRLSR